LAGLGLAGLLAIGCNGAGHAVPPAPDQDREEPSRRPTFNEKKAFDLLVKQCDFGPRPVGTPAHEKTAQFLLDEMKKYADKTAAQKFTYRDLPLTNVIGVFNPAAPRKVLLCAHWDTRPRADMEQALSRRSRPILGANDGASGVAVLLELARLFKERKPEIGVVIVLFDGEDYGDFNTDEGVFLGSRHFAKNVGEYKAEFGILLDMIGDRDLNIHREQNSEDLAKPVNDKVFTIAKELGYSKQFRDYVKHNVSDDHIPLNEVSKIPTIDLIDFDYPPWHTLSDTPEKCSPESLKAVGETLAELIYREKK
jgi:hypothetical protein